MLSSDIELVAYGVAKNVTALQLSKFVQDKGLDILDCVQLTKYEGARSLAFKVKIKAIDFEKAKNVDIWPFGVGLRRYKHFNNIQPKEKNFPHRRIMNSEPNNVRYQLRNGTGSFDSIRNKSMRGILKSGIHNYNDQSGLSKDLLDRQSPRKTTTPKFNNFNEQIANGLVNNNFENQFPGRINGIQSNDNDMFHNGFSRHNFERQYTKGLPNFNDCNGQFSNDLNRSTFDNQFQNSLRNVRFVDDAERASMV